MGIRSDRVQGQMRKEVSRILQEDLKDPVLSLGFADQADA